MFLKDPLPTTVVFLNRSEINIHFSSTVFSFQRNNIRSVKYSIMYCSAGSGEHEPVIFQSSLFFKLSRSQLIICWFCMLDWNSVSTAFTGLCRPQYYIEGWRIIHEWKLREKPTEYSHGDAEMQTLLILNLSRNLAVHSNKWYSLFKHCDSLDYEDQRFRKKSIYFRAVKLNICATAIF